MDGCVFRTEEGRCLKFSDDKHESWCVGKENPCGSRKKSHGDEIREYSDEELAEYLIKKYENGVFAACGTLFTRKEREYYIKRQIEWLKEASDK